MTDYKYRVYDSYTGNEFADVATLKLALDLTDGLREASPGVTIDEIVPEPSMRTPIVGDTVRTVGESLLESDDVRIGTLEMIDPNDPKWKYQVRSGTDEDPIWDWYRNVSLT